MYFHTEISRRNFWAASLGLACAVRAFAEEPTPEIPPYNKMSDKDEIRLGKEIADGIEKEEHLKFVEVGSVRDYVEDIFRKITKTSLRPNLPYSIKVVDTKEINAFALPGGFVYLNRGLLEWARSESEVVATLSHETGHVVGRHGANNISRESTADSLLSEASQVLFGDDLPARLLKQAGGPVLFLARMKFSREEEAQADLFGYYNMQRAGWDATGMKELFQHLSEQESISNPLITITSTHPPATERKANIEEEMKQFPPRPGLKHDSDSFHKVQAALKKLPPPATEQKLFGQ
jgi:beta-barrel assembly-enhancing protease